MATKLKSSDYEMLATIGTGSFGRVRLIKHKSTGKYFAVKIMKKAEIIRHKQVDHILSENRILGQIHHPFMVHLEGIFQDERYLYLVMDYIQGGELFTYLRGIGKLDNLHARFYSAQVVSMFEYLHSKDIIYRDLKPENILIDGEGYLKLTDFGFAKVIESRTYTLCGTPEYLAPEILLNKGHGKPVDWWCVGILTYEMLVGIDPFTDEDPMAIYQKILKGKVRYPRDFNKEAKSLVKHLLVADLTKRYGNLKNGVEDIKNHRWFNGLDWSKLNNRLLDVPYKPVIKSASDTSNFSVYPDSDTLAPAIKKGDDPFLEWQPPKENE